VKYFNYILLITIICLALNSNAQNYTLSIAGINSQQNHLIEKLDYKKQFSFKNQRIQQLNNILLDLYDEGYITANFDSLVEDSSDLLAYLNTGDKYTLAYLKKGNVGEALLSEVGFREKLYSDKPFNYKEIKNLNEKILTYCENNGYPFASIKLDSITIEQNNIRASLNLAKNIKITIDSIIIKGDAKISRAYLYSYIGIRPGDLYDESQIRKIKTKMKELQFLKEIKPFEIAFYETEEADIYLYAEKKNASQFDGVLGVLPNNETTGKLLLSGDVRLKLLNSFGRGELVDFNWRKIEQNTQDLKFNLVYPFLFSTPFGLDFKFALYKKDTTYLNVNKNIGVQYIFRGNNYLKAFLDNRQSSLLSTKGLEYISALPPYADISTTLYGLELKNDKLDYIFNPRKGYQIRLSGAAGSKNIKKNAKINQSVYNNLELTTTQYQLEADAGVFIPLLKRATILLSTQNAYIGNSNLFENELFRIGGLKTLRGFDEESINASLFSILTVEYRYLLEQNSYLNIFWNGAYYEKDTHDKFVCDRPFGFGAGLSFETKAGIFSISYALGKQFDNPIYFRSAKIHFGIVNHF